MAGGIPVAPPLGVPTPIRLLTARKGRMVVTSSSSTSIPVAGDFFYSFNPPATAHVEVGVNLVTKPADYPCYLEYP
jgi:hypothetical protein